MYENISGLVSLDAPVRYKIAIVGEPKTGKSWLAMTAPGNIYVCDFDARFESYREFVRKSGRTDIVSKTYVDLNPTQPDAVSKLETDIAMFEYEKAQGRQVPDWYVLDSITYLKVMCEHELIKQHPSMSRSVKLGPNATIKIPEGWDIINGNKGYLEYLIGRLGELGNIIAIFHELDEKDNQKSTKKEKAYTGKKTIQPQYLATLLSLFNDVWRVTLDYNNNRIVTVQPNSDFMAATSMTLLSPEEKPDIAEMIKKQLKG